MFPTKLGTGDLVKPGRSDSGSIAVWHFDLIYSPNRPFQRTRATKRLGVFMFRGVARGAERGRWASMNKENNMHVWRYMSFAKFVWTIQNKCLWLSRADLLGDPWEISLSVEQLQLVIDRQPITPVGEAPKETAEERAERIINLWRSNTFISCWNKSLHESNALWKIYCKNTEGVAL